MIISLSSVLINYYDVLFVLQQCFRIRLCCQCINSVSSSPSSFSGLSPQSCHLTTLSDADPGQSPDAQEETCFSLGPSAQPSSPSTLTLCFLNTVHYFDHNLLLSLPSPVWLEDVWAPNLVLEPPFRISV